MPMSFTSQQNAHNNDDSEKEGKELVIAEETQHLNWYVACHQPCSVLKRQIVHASLPLTNQSRKLNTSPSTVAEKEALKKLLTNPPVKKIDLHFPLGLEVTARNLKGVTIKDALDAIHKQYKKKVWFLEVTMLSQSLADPFASIARRRTRVANIGWVRMGQGRVLDEADCSPKEGRPSTREQEESQEGRRVRSHMNDQRSLIQSRAPFAALSRKLLALFM